jgi:sugar phosphate isomerase/epimerase
MRVGISNLAWDTAEDDGVVDLLHRFEVDSIDIAPGKYFPDFATASDADIERVRAWWQDRGIEICGMQALLFGTQRLNVFGDEASRAAMLDHLMHVCRIGGALRAPRVVFGSPKNRDRSGLTDEQTAEQARTFFGRLGDHAARYGVTVCLEPNPPRYGANYMTTDAETARVVRALGHPSVKMQFDTGALAITGEDPQAALADHAALIGHVHVSEPDLVTIGDGSTPHERMAAALQAHLPDSLVTIEMVASKTEPHLAAMERALRFVSTAYRPSKALPA